MKITAAQVNELRQKTGAGMMDCKKALQEAEGDMQTAIEVLRKKGQKVAAKRSDRDAAEGLVLATTNDASDTGILIVLNCETDFVAKNEDFGKFANVILDAAVSNQPSNLDELLGLSFEGTSMTIQEKITEQIGTIGEKIEVSAFEKVNAPKVFAYNHPGNKLASLVGFNKGTSDDTAKDVAMQVAAMNPVAISPDQIPADLAAKELEIGKALAIQEGKPEEMADKIAQGRLNKWYKESTLLNQAYIKDAKQSVQQFLTGTDSELSVTEMRRCALS